MILLGSSLRRLAALECHYKSPLPKRAERRLGEMMAQQKETVGMATGGEHGGRARIDGVRNTPAIARPTLAQAGIDKNLAKATRGRGAVERPQTIRARACALGIKPQQIRMTRFWHGSPRLCTK